MMCFDQLYVSENNIGLVFSFSLHQYVTLKLWFLKFVFFNNGKEKIDRQHEMLT